MKFRYPLLLFLLTPLLIQAQNDFPGDTSFTVWSAWQKIRNNFPRARPVKPFRSDCILSLPDQVYRVRKNRLLRMDLFLPNDDQTSKRPAVLLIHGGGWRSGNKSHLVPLAQKLAMDGYVTATAEHRLSAEACYPAAVYDLKEAIRFLKQNHAIYGIDTTRIAVLGCSSGATLASLVAATGKPERYTDPDSAFPGYSAKVQALINIDGIVDFTDPNESGKDQNPDRPSAGALWFGGTYREIPDTWVEASPLSYVDGNTPPTLYVNSALERFHAGRDTFLKVLIKHHTPYKIHTIPGTPHTFWLFYPWFGEAHNQVRDFLNQIFAPAPLPENVSHSSRSNRIYSPGAGSLHKIS